MSDSLLFIGGCLDGRWMPVPDGMSVFLWHDESEVETAYDDFRESRPMPPKVRYDRMRVAGNSRQWSVFKLQSMTADDVMLALIQGYQKDQL